MNAARLTVLAAFIRGQANLTDKHPHTPGPGEVKLNHAEAIEVADALDALLGGAAEGLDVREAVAALEAGAIHLEAEALIKRVQNGTATARAAADVNVRRAGILRQIAARWRT